MWQSDTTEISFFKGMLYLYLKIYIWVYCCEAVSETQKGNFNLKRVHIAISNLRNTCKLSI